MLGYASSFYYIDDGHTVPLEEEAAGKVGRALGIVAAIVVPFAAPAVFGAIAGSGALGAGLASAAASGTIGGLTSALGSAVVGGIMNAGVAYASGARGGDVWRAAGVGAIGGGVGSIAGAAGGGAGAASGGAGAAGGAGALNVAPLTTAPLANTGAFSVAPLSTAPITAGAAPLASGAAAGAPSSTITGSIQRMFGNVDGDTMRRIGATLVNAAVNGQNMGQMNALVEQQRAELAALAASDRATYEQRINAAQQILADADRMDPRWHARIAMADVAGIEANEFRQAMRNIAVSRGGLNAGQQRAYERSKSLHTARSKALAYNKASIEAGAARNQLRGAGAQLLGPNTGGLAAWQADTDLQAAAFQEQADNNRNSWGTFVGGILESGDHRPATSPDPSEDEDNGNSNGFAGGLIDPFGGN